MKNFHRVWVMTVVVVAVRVVIVNVINSLPLLALITQRVIKFVRRACLLFTTTDNLINFTST